MLSTWQLGGSCLLLILLVNIHNGSALRCWTCTSDTNPDCNDPFEETSPGPIACIPPRTQPDKMPGLYPVCTKARIHVNELESVVIRQCEWVSDSYPNICENHPGLPQHSHMEFCESCRGDGCNGVGLPTASTWTITAASIILTLLVML
ncbi:UPAR/Ly6 domain-containing protein crok [Anabrus simplex]|uniref:UPAR/Ly6 domain-containing protein crok n=1 Tax=Anabrus simplex TaxID=316456 RepID=UPI0035A37112